MINVKRREWNDPLGVFESDIDPELWAAVVADPQVPSITLIPLTVKDCGCVLNLGGWVTKMCALDAAEAEKEEVPRHEDGLFDELTGDPRAEQERIYREVSA